MFENSKKSFVDWLVKTSMRQKQDHQIEVYYNL